MLAAASHCSSCQPTLITLDPNSFERNNTSSPFVSIYAWLWGPWRTLQRRQLPVSSLPLPSLCLCPCRPLSFSLFAECHSSPILNRATKSKKQIPLMSSNTLEKVANYLVLGLISSTLNSRRMFCHLSHPHR